MEPRFVALHFVDTAGLSRVKVVPGRRLDALARSGTGWSDVWAVVTVDEHFAYVPPFDTPSGDSRLVPALESLRPLECQPGWAWVAVDQYDQDLQPLPTCPRAVLRRAVERLVANDIEVMATFEVELTVLRDGAPAHSGPGYSVRALHELAAFADEFATALEAQRVPVEQFHPEYSPGQFEVSIEPADPIEAADRLLNLRYTARAVAHRHGLDVSFAPVVFTGGLGNGSHLHLSAWRGGRSLMSGGPAPGGMDRDGAAFTAGILEHLPDAMAVLAPSVPSYSRLQPGHWSGAYACWGVENREAALRFIPGTISSRERSANVEVKVVDGAANAYYALAVALIAGADGIRRGLVLPDPTQADPALGAVPRLPATLGEAAERFAGSAVLRDGLGGVLHDAIVAVRRKEWADHGAKDESDLVELHRFAY